MAITLRTATAADQQLIVKLVHDAHLNFLRLAWPNFLIAERTEDDTANPDAAAGRVVGIGQLRPHWDGTLELASLMVVESEQGKGVGSLLVNALIAKADRPLFLMTKQSNVTYYERFGFYELTSGLAVPPSVRALYYLAAALRRVMAVFSPNPPRLAIMAHAAKQSRVR